MNHQEVVLAHDICSLPLIRRLSALLDRDPKTLSEGAPLPRGWHLSMFNTPTVQSRLRPDGAAELGVPLPDIGLPRLMLGGREMSFQGEIPIGARVRRESRQGPVNIKQGRSGRFALVPIEHRVYVEGSQEPAIVETSNYVLREAPSGERREEAPGRPGNDQPRPAPDATRSFVPDEPLLFRYSAITDNPHRIHYDLEYATRVEGYPALVVNGSIPSLFLLELFRSTMGCEPRSFSSRNIGPMFCGRELTLCIRKQESGWRLWAQDPEGATTLEATVA